MIDTEAREEGFYRAMLGYGSDIEDCPSGSVGYHVETDPGTHTLVWTCQPRVAGV